MARFRYEAVDGRNARQTGTVEAASAEEVARDLVRQGRFVLSVAPERPAASLWALLNKDIALRPPIGAREIVTLTQEWAGLLAAGVGLADVLTLSAANAKRPSVAALVARVSDRVRKGSAFHAALEQERGFPPAYVAIVGAGETAGDLAPTMQRLAEDLEASRDFAERLSGSLLYPAFLTITATGAVAVLLAVVVPNLKALIEAEPGRVLPFATRAVIAASDFFRHHGADLAAAVAVGAAALVVASRVAAGRAALDRLVLRLPVAGPILLALEIGRYLRALSALLAGGVSLSRALPLAGRTLSNRALRNEFEAAHGEVLHGKPLAEALEARRRLSPEILTLVRMGEQTGRLAETTGAAARLLEKRARRRLEAITTIVGPALTVVFGLVAGLIVYAMMSAILDMNDAAFG